jgi:hypothetical protein
MSTAQLAHEAALAAAAERKKGKGGKGEKKKHKALAALSMGSGVVPWSKAEEQVLCAVVNEFKNWALVSDILNGSAVLKGVARRPDKCMEHYKLLLQKQQDGDGGDDVLQIPKSAARTLLQRAGLLEENVMVRHHDVLNRVAARHRAPRPDGDLRRQPVHESHTKLLSRCPDHMSPVAIMTQCMQRVATYAQGAVQTVELQASGGQLGGGGGLGGALGVAVGAVGLGGSGAGAAAGGVAPGKAKALGPGTLLGATAAAGGAVDASMAAIAGKPLNEVRASSSYSCPSGSTLCASQ